MANVDVKSVTGEVLGTAELPDAIFGIQPNVPVMHQVVTAQLAAARSGTHKVKTRAEVRGGGAKPWRQKGTGRARQGSTRAPHWRGGGVVHGPTPRDYRQRTPKKMVRLALRSALSDRAAEGKVLVIDDWSIATPKTKDAKKALAALGLSEGRTRALIVLGPNDEAPWKSFRNLGDRVQIIVVGELNAYDVLVNDWIVFTNETLQWLSEKQQKREAAAGTVTNDSASAAGTPSVSGTSPGSPVAPAAATPTATSTAAEVAVAEPTAAGGDVGAASDLSPLEDGGGE